MRISDERYSRERLCLREEELNKTRLTAKARQMVGKGGKTLGDLSFEAQIARNHRAQELNRRKAGNAWRISFVARRAEFDARTRFSGPPPRCC
jgi:hypothetical protein